MTNLTRLARLHNPLIMQSRNRNTYALSRRLGMSVTTFAPAVVRSDTASLPTAQCRFDRSIRDPMGDAPFLDGGEPLLEARGRRCDRIHTR